MSASPRADIPMAASSEAAEAVYFPSAERQLFGWVHRATSETIADMGLVLCNPFGYEAICSHRSVRKLAEEAARLGIPALRFDYSGTGDSGDISPDSDQIELWSNDIVSAAAELRRQTGITTVCLLGIRLGALLAILAAGRCKSVTSLIVVAPVISGKRYLSELRMTRLAAPFSSGQTTSVSTAPSNTRPSDSGEMEVSGFSFFAATRKALAALDTPLPDAVRLERVLILDESSLPSAKAWQEKLLGSGVEATYAMLPGLFKMTMTAPHTSNVPQAMVVAVSEWLLRHRVASATSLKTRAVTQFSASAPAHAFMVLSNGEDSTQPPITERPFFLDAKATLFGVLTEPHRSVRLDRAIVLLNQGANHHIGGSRVHVTLARHWAALGYSVLRLDLAGIGDSANSPGSSEDDVFPEAAVDNIRYAIDFIRARYGPVHVSLGGLCSGGYHALRAAVDGIAINCIFAVNPQNYFWKKGMFIHELQLAQVLRDPGVYYKRIFSYRVMKKLFMGQIDLWQITRVFINSFFPYELWIRDAARILHIRLQRDLGRELREIAERGVRIIFVFARGEAGIDLLKLEAGATLNRLGDQCRVHIVDSADHVFSRRAPREALARLLDRELLT